MAVIIDTVRDHAGRLRHPEKAHRPDQPSGRKPDWIRVKAPVSPGYVATREIVGATCTRACAFCNVKTGLPSALDPAEPEHVAEATAKLGLTHVVITSVD